MQREINEVFGVPGHGNSHFSRFSIYEMASSVRALWAFERGDEGIAAPHGAHRMGNRCEAGRGGIG